MRKFVMFVVLLHFLFDAAAQNTVAQVTCTFLNRPNAEVAILKPVQHAVFFAARRIAKLDQKASITISFTNRETGFLKIICKDQVIDLYVQNGDSIQVVIDTGQTAKPFITGSNKDGQTLFNEPSMPSYYRDALPLFRMDTTIEMLSKHVESEKQKYIEQFGKLYDARQIDSSFFNFSKKNLDYLYATVLVEKMSSRFFKASYAKTNTEYHSIFTEEYANYWDAVLNHFPLNDSSILSLPAYEWYADNMINANFYRKRWEKGDTAKQDQNTFIRRKFEDIEQYFKGNFEALTKARVLYSMYIQEQFEQPLIEIFENFSRQPLAAPYLPFLQPYHQKIKTFHASVTSPKTQNINFIKNSTQINSFQQLKELFKGRKLYIDIWATWCGPCKEEFKYKEEIKKVLASQSVEPLYISMDLPERDEQWRKMIQYYQLSGHHIRTSDALRNDLMKLFWDGNSYTIPRYLLVDENGMIRELNAARPSDVKELQSQLEKMK